MPGCLQSKNFLFCKGKLLPLAWMDYILATVELTCITDYRHGGANPDT